MRWYHTDLPFLEGTTLINMRQYGPDNLQLFRVGELPAWAANRNYNHQWTMPAGLTGRHICERRWFATGEPWPTALPDSEYDDKWIPLCCRVFHDAAEGGLEIGGEVGDALVIIDPTAGGVEVGGASGDGLVLIDPTAGGVEVGGEVGDTFTSTDPTEGGAEVGGAAGDHHAWTDATEGGVEFSGEVGDTLANIDPTAGGVEVGGEVGDTFTSTDPTEGGAEVGGAAGDHHAWTDATEGGAQMGGAAGDLVLLIDATAGGGAIGGAAGDVVQLLDATAGGGAIGGAAGDVGRLLDATAGGVSIGGAAGDVYTPATVTPGATCAAAATVTQGTTYGYSISGFTTQHWFTFVLLSTGTWHVSTTGASGPSGASMTLFGNGSCPSPTPQTVTTSGPPKWVWSGTAGDVMRIRFNAPFSGSAPYTFVWDSGP